MQEVTQDGLGNDQIGELGETSREMDQPDGPQHEMVGNPVYEMGFLHAVGGELA